MNKITPPFLVIAILSIFFGMRCNRPLIVNCDDCYTNEPLETELKIQITINNENRNVPIRVFLGTYDTGEEILADTVTTNIYYLTVETKKTYSVIAEYHKDGKTIRVVDGRKIKTYLDNESCDSPCWIVTGNTLDARLKF